MSSSQAPLLRSLSRRLFLTFGMTAAFLALKAPSLTLGQSGTYAASYHAAQAAAYQRQQEAAAYYQYQQQMAAYQQYQQQQAAYQQQVAYQRQQAAYQQQMAARAVPQAAPMARSSQGYLRFDGRYAAAPSNAPDRLHYAIAAANYLQNKPYRRGGGHANVEDNAYDCSGSASYVLIKAGLLRAPLPSTGFANYGERGEGRFITIWVKPGEHVFITVCGLRLDTTGGREGEGPRWRSAPRSTAGFTPRHPPGF